VRKALQSMLVHYDLATLGQYLEFRQSTYTRYWINVFIGSFFSCWYNVG